MPAYGIIGAQWGDEGKGKVVDFLSERADFVVRFSGGNNAGHTVINDKGEFALHLVPAGIFWPHCTSVIGPGVVVDPGALLEEIDALESRGVDTSGLVISDHAHVVMPYHVKLDQLEEQARGENAIGTTGRGIGPAYVDKTARAGIRIGDLLDAPYLRERLTSVVAAKNLVLTKVYEADPIDLEALYNQCLEYGTKLQRYVTNVEQRVSDALDRGERVVLEGAQGALLDLDHGTYPFVTSSSVSIGGACTGLGIPPQRIESIIGIFKAYSTRVGAGPMATELNNATGEHIREVAQEYGATTGRARRVGWFDGVAAAHSRAINGFTSAVLTRLDVLDGMPSVQICVAYEVDGKRYDRFPSLPGLLARATPVLEEMSGWIIPTAGVTDLDQLPKEARAYVDRIQEIIGCPIDLISTGPKRHESITVRPIVPDAPEA
ncbi:MAG: adenylosuccinate synthase [Chloroflexi bacterium]|nr:adenylosuccinate synthase [Chloroflexota bacterium]MDA1173913.1 adenylosuccinate synthase [Chloroflexota bacterium]